MWFLLHMEFLPSARSVRKPPPIYVTSVQHHNPRLGNQRPTLSGLAQQERTTLCRRGRLCSLSLAGRRLHRRRFDLGQGLLASRDDGGGVRGADCIGPATMHGRRGTLLWPWICEKKRRECKRTRSFVGGSTRTLPAYVHALRQLTYTPWFGSSN